MVCYGQKNELANGLLWLEGELSDGLLWLEGELADGLLWFADGSRTGQS